jgi:hypothetical protein
MFFAFSSALPTLLAGFACSSRRTSSVTSRGFIPPHFSNVFRLLVGSADTSRRLCLQTLPIACKGENFIFKFAFREAAAR